MSWTPQPLPPRLWTLGAVSRVGQSRPPIAGTGSESQETRCPVSSSVPSRPVCPSMVMLSAVRARLATRTLAGLVLAQADDGVLAGLDGRLASATQRGVVAAQAAGS